MNQDDEAERDHSVSRDQDEELSGRRARPEGAERHPLIDLSRDPNPGRPDHARTDD